MFKATDYKGSKVAAKRVDIAGLLLPNIVRDVEKLKQLDRLNIVKVYGMHQSDKTVWIFMEQC